MKNVVVNGRLIEQLREKQVLDRREFAEKAGVGYSTLAKLETDFKNTARPQTVRKIAYALGVAATDLIITIGENVGQ